MRNLFVSEKRCISNLIAMNWNSSLRFMPAVVHEYVVEPSNPVKRSWFNCDFSLDFVDPRIATFDHVTTMSPVLPNTLGAEVFLVVEKDTFAPMRLELIGGQAFPPKHFREYLQQVEAAILRLVEGSDFLRRVPELSKQDILSSIRPKSFMHARVFVVGSDICFLFCAKSAVPQALGEQFELARGEEYEILFYIEDSKITCVDGWLRTEVKSSEFKLVATSVPPENSRSE